MSTAPIGQCISMTAQIIPRGDGTYTLKPSKPTEWLWVREAARESRVSSKTVLRWIRTGYVIGRKVGVQRWQVDAASLAFAMGGNKTGTTGTAEPIRAA